MNIGADLGVDWRLRVSRLVLQPANGRIPNPRRISCNGPGTQAGFHLLYLCRIGTLLMQPDQ